MTTQPGVSLPYDLTGDPGPLSVGVSRSGREYLTHQRGQVSKRMVIAR